MDTKLHVHSIFESISGEVGTFPQGTFCSFIRLQGCNLNCSWCDTPLARSIHMAEEKTIDEIMSEIKTKYVVITGGEPLLQMKNLVPLLERLTRRRHEVQVETNGSILLPYFRGLPPTHSLMDVGWVVDYKCPSSVESGSMQPIILYEEMIRVNKAIVKFVIKDQADLFFAIDKAKILSNGNYMGKFAFSPLDGKEMITAIYEGIRSLSFLRDRSILSIQIHKIANLS